MLYPMEPTKPNLPLNIRLIVGLGNPGSEYQNTYHNAGRILLHMLMENLKPDKKTRNKNFNAFRVGKTWLLEPETFMNESGIAVSEFLKQNPIEAENILVLHDESDLKAGDTRFDFGRGTAGHRGVASLLDSLGGKDFWRCRIGIRSKENEGDERQKAEEFVLRNISPKDKQEIYSSLETVSRTIEKLILNETP